MSKLVKVLLSLGIVLALSAQAMPNVPNKAVTAKTANKPSWYKPKNASADKQENVPKVQHQVSSAQMKKLLSALASTDDKNKRQKLLAKAFKQHAKLNLKSKDIDLTKSSLRIEVDNRTAALPIAALAVSLVIGSAAELLLKAAASQLPKGLAKLTGAIAGGATASAIDLHLNGTLTGIIVPAAGTVLGFVLPHKAALIAVSSVVGICSYFIETEDQNKYGSPGNNGVINYTAKATARTIKYCIVTPARDMVHQAVNSKLINDPDRLEKLARDALARRDTWGLQP